VRNGLFPTSNLGGKMKNFLKKAFTLSILTVFLTVAAAWSEEVVRLNGSTTVQKRIMEPGKEALEKATGIKLVLTGNGTGSGLEDLVKGR